MSSFIKVVLIFSFLLLIFGFFTGCIFDDILSRDSFIIKSWQIVDNEGFPTLELNFNSSGSIRAQLINENNTIMDSSIVFYGQNSTSLNISSYRNNIINAEYTLQIFNKNSNEIFERQIDLEGGKLTIISCRYNIWRNNLLDDTIHLVGLNFTVYNNGDTPIYPCYANMNFDKLYYRQELLPEVIQPGEQKSLYCFLFIEDFNQDSNFDLNLADSFNRSICSKNNYSISSEIVESKTYEWRHQGKLNILNIPNISFLYDYYSEIERIQKDDYSSYVFDSYDDNYLTILIDNLFNLEKNPNDEEKINYLASFVQNLDYISDFEENVSLEYPRYPIETLLFKGGGGDCEDKAILTASLLDLMGYNVSLLRLTSHMAVGVKLTDNLSSYDKYFDGYYFLETTSKNHEIGYVPEKYENDINLTVYPIYPRPYLYSRWDKGTIMIYKNTFLGDIVMVKVYIENLGTSTANNIHIKTGFFTDSGIESNIKNDTIESLNPKNKRFIVKICSIPKDFNYRFKTLVIVDGRIVDENQSESYFP